MEKKIEVSGANKNAVKGLPEKEEKKVTKENEANVLQAEIDQKTAELQKCLAELERKKTLSYHRSLFIQTLEALQTAENKMQETEDFETKLFKLRFEDDSLYRDKDIFSISNRDILLEFVSFIREKIKTKIADIEVQLIA